MNILILVPLHAELLHLVRDHVHYIPAEWLKDPRSSRSQKYFSQLFQVCHCSLYGVRGVLFRVCGI